MIVLIDFGSQTTHLISRRLKELGAKVKIVNPEDVLSAIENASSVIPAKAGIQKTEKAWIPDLVRDDKIQGIILSGGPSSVYAKNAPSIDPEIFNLKIPILGICYGMQLTAHLLGGKVIPGKKEYGPSEIKLSVFNSQLSKELSKSSIVG